MHKVAAVCIGRAEEISPLGVETGIFKRATAETQQLTKLGFADDKICDLNHHGGEMQALYVMGDADYDFWSKDLDRELEPGIFGENLLLTGIDSGKIGIGDRLVLANAELVATSPRIPCSKLAARFGDKRFAKHFMAADHPGFYCKVTKEGSITVGDEVRLEPAEGAETILARFAASRSKYSS